MPVSAAALASPALLWLPCMLPWPSSVSLSLGPLSPTQPCMQVKAVKALEIGSWGDHGGDMVAHLSKCLPATLTTLKLVGNAVYCTPQKESTAGGRRTEGGFAAGCGQFSMSSCASRCFWVG